MVTFADYRREFERDGVGQLIWDSLLGVAGRIARRYPPGVYSDVGDWSEEALQDLAQEVVLERLLAQGQLDYVFDLAESVDSLAALLAVQVRRVLAHRRAISVVDRLLHRVRKLVEDPSFLTAAHGSDVYVTLAGRVVSPRPASDEELHRCVARIASVPRIPSNPNGERESKVYSAEDLSRILALVLDDLDGLLISDLRRIFEISLTAWLPTILRDSEEDQISELSPELEAERANMTSLIEGFLGQLDETQQRVLLGKSQGISDGDLAKRIGRSRPWVADRKIEVLEMLEEHLVAQVPEALQVEATRMLLDELVVRVQEEGS
jgi:hypothetical protein